MMLGQNQNSAQLDVIKKKYGFDKPLSDQYFLYLNPFALNNLKPVSMSERLRFVTILVSNVNNLFAK